MLASTMQLVAAAQSSITESTWGGGRKGKKEKEKKSLNRRETDGERNSRGYYKTNARTKSG